MMVIMWFSGLRGAIAYALCLHLDIATDSHMVLVTTTLCIVLFTVIGLGGTTMPLLKFLEKKKNRRGRKKEITLSKTRELGAAIDSEHLSEMTEEELDLNATSGAESGSGSLERGQPPPSSNSSGGFHGFLYYDYK